MSSLVTTTCPARRLLSLAGRGAINTGRRGYAKPLLKQPVKPSSRGSPPPQPSPSPPSRVKSHRPPGSSSLRTAPRLIFSSENIPHAEAWEVALRGLGNEDLSAKECVDAAHRYAAVATQYITQWKDSLQSKHSLSPYLLHWMGILLMAVNGIKAQRDRYWPLATHMLNTASELGYAPSTLTLVRFFEHWRNDPRFDRIAESQTFRAASARFGVLVKTGQDPSALTLRGLILTREGAHDRALDSFRKATKAWQSAPGKPKRSSAAAAGGAARPRGELVADGTVVLPKAREPRWDWEASCLLGEADILKARGALKQARDLYRVAALELDHPRGFLELANAMGGPRDGPERRTYLLKAAVSGEPAAFRELGVVEEMRAREKGITERESNHRLLESKEWFRLADEVSAEK